MTNFIPYVLYPDKRTSSYELLPYEVFLYELLSGTRWREETALIADSLLTPSKEIGQLRYQVGMKTQTYDLGDDNSVVYKNKGLPKVYGSNSERSVTFVPVAV